LALMLYLTQLLFDLVDVSTSFIVFRLSFTECFFHFFFLLVHAEKFVIIALCSVNDAFYFFFILAKLISVVFNAGCTLIHGLLLESDLLFNALNPVVLLVEEYVLLVVCRRLLTQ